MYDQIREDAFFILIYGGVTAIALMAGCYLLLRRSNAFAPDIMPPVRLRRWAGALLAAFAMNHLWYMPRLQALLLQHPGKHRQACRCLQGAITHNGPSPSHLRRHRLPSGFQNFQKGLRICKTCGQRPFLIGILREKCEI